MLRGVVALSCVFLLAAAAHAAVSPITSASFRETIKSQEFTLVNFYAKWCPFSQKMAPIYSKLSEELSSLAHFASVDVDEDKHLTALEHVLAVPTLKLFRNGAFVGSYQGKLEMDALKDWIKKMTVSFPALDSCASRAARMEKKTLFVAFYKNNVNPALSSAPVDAHTSALAAVSHAVGQKAVVVEHDEESRALMVELGGAGRQNPAYALIDWVPRDAASFSLRVRFFDDSKPYPLDSLVSWAVGCLDGKECRYVASRAHSSVVVPLSAANYETYIHDSQYDVIVAFANKNTMLATKELLEHVSVAAGNPKTLRFAIVDVDIVPSAKAFVSGRSEAQSLPSIWMFSAADKHNPVLSFSNLPQQESAVDALAAWAAKTATHKFQLPHPAGSDKKLLPDVHISSYWSRVLTTLAKWLGAFWVKF